MARINYFAPGGVLGGIDNASILDPQSCVRFEGLIPPNGTTRVRVPVLPGVNVIHQLSGEILVNESESTGNPLGKQPVISTAWRKSDGVLVLADSATLGGYEGDNIQISDNGVDGDDIYFDWTNASMTRQGYYCIRFCDTFKQVPFALGAPDVGG